MSPSSSNSSPAKSSEPRKLRIGLYGSNGHQMMSIFKGHPWAEIVAYSGFKIPDGEIQGAPVEYDSLESMLRAPSVEMISLCSPRRADQPKQAIQCLEAGKHVYAEKPCAMDEESLDSVLETAKRCGRQFREMISVRYEYPFCRMREVVQSGVLGEIVQIFSQKSYPYHDGRPMDENVDGGLLLQVGIHSARMIEYIGGSKIQSLAVQEAKVCIPDKGDFNMAYAIQGKLENGGICSAVVNYLHTRGFGHWGNDHLRIFGTKGMVETFDGASLTRLSIGESAPVLLTPREGEVVMDYETHYFRSLLGLEEIPMSQEDELHPLRALLRARR